MRQKKEAQRSAKSTAAAGEARIAALVNKAVS